MFLGGEGMNPRRMVSEKVAESIDREVKEIVETAHQQALDILTQNRELLETIATQLLETEVIEGETLQHLLRQVKAADKIPAGIA